MIALRAYQQEIIEGVRAAWRTGAHRPLVQAPCGCGKTVIAADMARRAAENGCGVLAIAHRREIVEQLTRAFGEQVPQAARANVRVSMVQTECRRTREPAPALILVDECHHTLARSYLKVLAAYPDARVVGFTATPERLSGENLGRVYDRLIEGPDTPWLIEHACLAPVETWAPMAADLNGLHTRRGEFIEEEVEARMMRTSVYGDVIAHFARLSEGRQAICYCASVRHSQEMARAFAQAGVPALHVDGHTPERERDDAVSAFRAGTVRVLCNVDLISEGFDAPDCGMSILLRPTQSLALYVQQAMRCMRYVPGKTARVLDHVGNAVRFGLPDAPRRYELGEKAGGQTPRKTQANKLQCRVCPMCYFTHAPAPVCPACGHRYAPAREIQAHPDAVLARCERAPLTISTKRPSDCRTFAELAAYGQAHGYKKGWAYYQWQSRQSMTSRPRSASR